MTTGSEDSSIVSLPTQTQGSLRFKSGHDGGKDNLSLDGCQLLPFSTPILLPYFIENAGATKCQQNPPLLNAGDR